MKDFSYVHEIEPSLYDLVFKAENVPAFGIHVYYVEAGNAELNKNVAKTTNNKQYIGNSVSNLLKYIEIANKFIF